MEMIKLIAKIVISIDVPEKMSSILHLFYSNARGMGEIDLNVIKRVLFAWFGTKECEVAFISILNKSWW